MKHLAWVWVLIICTCACSSRNQTSGDHRLKVVTTTGMLYDAVLNIGKDRVTVEALMGPGVDPHLYKATQGDLGRLNQADLIIYNGLFLEGKMSEILDRLSQRKSVLAAAESIPKDRMISASHFQSSIDPHVWFDVSLWKYVVQNISIRMQADDSVNATFYQSNTASYLMTLDTLHEYVKRRIASIPEQQRILVTAHDAFSYFGKAYQIRVEGLQGISTVSDFGLKDIADISDLIIQNKVKSIFVETSVSDKALQAVISGCKDQGHEVIIGGNLYSDAMGPPDTFEGTYVGMVQKNVETIVQALK